MSRTRYARSGALRIAYELRGTLHRRHAWLVMIQGMGFDRLGWQPVLGALGRHFRLVLVDNRGFGGSSRPAGSFSVADMADDVVAVLDAAGIRRAHVMGASLGGMVAQEQAITHPERVDGLVLACTAPGWPLAYPMPAASVRLLVATTGLTSETALRRHIENALSARTVREHPELVSRLVEIQRSPPANTAALSAQAAAGARYTGGWGQRRIWARTLVLQGGSDTVVDPRNARLLAGRIPGTELVIFPELGHLLFWEDPDGFADAAASFLLGRTRVRRTCAATILSLAKSARPRRQGGGERTSAATVCRRVGRT
jgi:3-oxoadipate enol-lactonase